MQRILAGVLLVVFGILFALQTFGLIALSLPFWPIVLTVLGLYLIVDSVAPNPFRWRPGPAWIKLSLGVWLGLIGVMDILHANGVAALSGQDVWSAGLFILLIGAGLALIFGGKKSGVSVEHVEHWGEGPRRGRTWRWSFGLGDDDSSHVLRLGDLHYGRQPWVLDRKLTVRQHAGDVRIDLTTAQIADGEHDIDVAAGVGEVVILVPEYCNANVRARVSAGGIRLFDEERDGIGVEFEKKVIVPEATVTLNIDVRLRAGQVVVRRVPSRA